jgi:hypothetical protein
MIDVPLEAVLTTIPNMRRTKRGGNRLLRPQEEHSLSCNYSLQSPHNATEMQTGLSEGVTTMGLRFRKRISLGGIAHLNLSATGVSLSVGPKGMNVNLGGIGPNRHRRMTVGLPGTGLYYQQRLDHKAARVARAAPDQPDQYQAPPTPYLEAALELPQTWFDEPQSEKSGRTLLSYVKPAIRNLYPYTPEECTLFSYVKPAIRNLYPYTPLLPNGCVPRVLPETHYPGYTVMPRETFLGGTRGTALLFAPCF